MPGTKQQPKKRNYRLASNELKLLTPGAQKCIKKIAKRTFIVEVSLGDLTYSTRLNENYNLKQAMYLYFALIQVLKQKYQTIPPKTSTIISRKFLAEQLESVDQDLIFTKFRNIALGIYHDTEKLQNLASEDYNQKKIKTMPNLQDPQNQVDSIENYQPIVVSPKTKYQTLSFIWDLYPEAFPTIYEVEETKKAKYESDKNSLRMNYI